MWRFRCDGYSYNRQFVAAPLQRFDDEVDSEIFTGYPLQIRASFSSVTSIHHISYPSISFFKRTCAARTRLFLRAGARIERNVEGLPQQGLWPLRISFLPSLTDAGLHADEYIIDV